MSRTFSVKNILGSFFSGESLAFGGRVGYLVSFMDAQIFSRQPDRRVRGIVRLCIAGVAALTAVGGGCNEQALSPEALAMLRSGISAYAEGDDRTTVERMDAFLADHNRGRRADEAFYYRGLANYRRGEREEAREDFAAALDRTRNPDLRCRARLSLGDVAYDAGDMDVAEQMYRESLAELDRSLPPTDHALYRLGASLQRMGEWPEADDYFSELIGNFPGSTFAARAERRAYARQWTIQVGAFAGRERAKSLVAELRGEHKRVAIWPDRMDGKIHFLVRVGRYGTYGEAAEAVDAVRRTVPEAFITVAW